MAPIEAEKTMTPAVKAARGKRTESPAPRSPKAAEDKEVEKPKKTEDAPAKASAADTSAATKPGRSYVGYLKKAVIGAVLVVAAVGMAMQLRLDYAGIDISAARQKVATMFTPMQLKVATAAVCAVVLLLGIYCIRGLIFSLASKAFSCCRIPFRKGAAPAKEGDAKEKAS
mmetsp:Transcript_31947/g.72892  ORF Transcript_31947/g.72892 Transcript_31947/m.72892 type:complete len:171 (+) Transcript_31947:56-568(+)